MTPWRILWIIQQIWQPIHKILQLLMWQTVRPFTLFTVSSSTFPTPPIRNCRTFKHLISKIGPYPCVAPGFQLRLKWELFPVDVASRSRAATSANKSFEEFFLDTVKPSPTKKGKRKSKLVSSRAQVRKLLPIKCNVGITKNTSCWFVLQINNMISI